MIADSIRGSDGLAFADINGDGLTDLFGVWELGRTATYHLHPGASCTDETEWPSGELATGINGAEGVLADDLDGDGDQDAIVFSEQSGVRIFFGDNDGRSWEELVLIERGGHRWLHGTLADFTGDGLRDVLAHGETSHVILFENPGPQNAHEASAWRQTVVLRARHAMRIFAEDVDGDGDLDAVVSQRRDARNTAPRGFWWGENGTNGGHDGTWTPHAIGGQGRRGMIACRGDLDGDGDDDYVVPYMRPGTLAWYERNAGASWTEHEIEVPDRWHRRIMKGCAIGDLDQDGNMDIALTTSSISQSNVWWLEGPEWEWHAVAQRSWESKLDEPYLIDIDGTGDLDIVVSGEQRDRGLVWFVNPTRGCSR